MMWPDFITRNEDLVVEKKPRLDGLPDFSEPQPPSRITNAQNLFSIYLEQNPQKTIRPEVFFRWIESNGWTLRPANPGD
jgi:hypothetical protein